MTKKELIKDLHNHGELWANESYSKKYLEEHLNDLKKARNMSIAELIARINKEV